MNEEEIVKTEVAEEQPMVSDARKKLIAVLEEIYPDEAQTGDVDQMALDYIMEQRAANDRIVKAMADEPRLGQVFVELMNGEGGGKTLVRHFGKSFLEMEEDSPEYEEMMAADREYREGRETMLADQQAYDEKAGAWFAAFGDYCERMKLNKDVYLVKIEDEFISPVMEWEHSDEVFDRLVKAVDYDKDVDDAFEAGEIKGRNTNINEMRAKPSDGMPSGLSSQAVVQPEKRRVNSLIEKALNA